MLKRFFISFLGTMAALWLSLIIFIFGFILMLGNMFASSVKDIEVRKNSVLYVNLEGTIPERRTSATLQDILEGTVPQSSLEEILCAIRQAKDDKCIKGIYLDCNLGALNGVASYEELLEGLLEFKKSGKWVYAYADSYSESEYLVASAADSVVLNPSGMVDVHGMASITPFYKGLLDKLGIQIQIVKVGTYKSAVEPFMLTEMSEPAKMQNRVFIDSIWNYYTKKVAANRNITPLAVKEWADSMIFTWPTSKVLEAKAVTALQYRRVAEENIKKLSGVDEDDDIRLVSVSDYLLGRGGLLKELDSDKGTHVALLYANGDIVDRGNEPTEISAEAIVPQINSLAEDDDVAALVLRVNSPGGSAFASEQIWEALNYFKSKGKPFYVSMGDYAASGGYYISCGADRIYADNTTLTGSIGVFGMLPNLQGLTDKVGINFTYVESNTNAVPYSPFRPMTEAQLAAMQKNVDNMYDLFTKRVAEGRKISQDSVKVIGEGRVWVGSSAIGIGLVDEIGSLETALNAMCQKVGLERNDVVSYPFSEASIWDSFLVGADMQMSINKKDLVMNEALKNILFINRLKSMNPIQARMPEHKIQ